MQYRLPDEAATEALGARLARVVETPLLVFLHGQLGTGKTTFCRGFLRALGHGGPVRSPTYTLCEPYQVGALQCLHCDFYRLSHAEEVEYLGLREQLTAGTVVLIEWPEVAAGALPAPDVSVRLQFAGHGRQAGVAGSGEIGQRVARAFERAGDSSNAV